MYTDREGIVVGAKALYLVLCWMIAFILVQSQGFEIDSEYVLLASSMR